jgi:hypothetical protein
MTAVWTRKKWVELVEALVARDGGGDRGAGKKKAATDNIWPSQVEKNAGRL